MAAPVPLKAVARMLDVPEKNLYARAREGRISVELRLTGRVRILADPDACRLELAQLRCQAPGCDQPAHRAGRFCSHACSVRAYASETRRCEECGEPFEVPGHRAVQPGQGRFCSPACWAAWRWEHEPETFPQSERRGAEKACRICSSTRYRPPSHQHLGCCSAECAHEAFRRWLATPAGAAWRAGSWIKGRHGEDASQKWFGRLALAINPDGKGAARLERQEPEIAERVLELLAKGCHQREIERIVNAEIASGRLTPRTSKRQEKGISRAHVRGVATRANKVGENPPSPGVAAGR